MTTRLLVGGKRNSGKSTLACSLFRALCEKGVSAELLELDPYSDSRDCILGTKPWAARQKVDDPPREEFLRRNRLFQESTADFVIGDLPGRIHAKNRLLLAGADGAIVVDRTALPTDGLHDPEKAEFDKAHHDPDLQAWYDHFTGAGIPVLCRAYSLRDDEPAPIGDLIPVRGLHSRSVVVNDDIVRLAQRLEQITIRVYQ